MKWSDELEKEMEILSPSQRRAIAMIVAGEANGLAMSRLLKTAYSCQWCGRVIGRSSDKREMRKALVAEHEEICVRGPKRDEEGEVVSDGQPWRFAANYSTFYSKWGVHFRDCLNKARQEVVNAALGEAARILQIGTPDAARELRRQVLDPIAKDSDRRGAAVAILDRADVSTASKGPDPMAEWLKELRGEMADDKPEEGDISPDKV